MWTILIEKVFEHVIFFTFLDMYKIAFFFPETEKVDHADVFGDDLSISSEDEDDKVICFIFFPESHEAVPS